MPLNRQASRRVLSRLVRESQRPGPIAEAHESVSIPTANLPQLATPNGVDSVDAFLNEGEVALPDNTPNAATTSPFDGDPELDLPDLDEDSLDLPNMGAPSLEPLSFQLDPEPELEPVRELYLQVEHAVDTAAPSKRSIFSDRQAHFESLDDSESSRGILLWVGVGALLVVALVAVSALI